MLTPRPTQTVSSDNEGTVQIYRYIQVSFKAMENWKNDEFVRILKTE